MPPTKYMKMHMKHGLTRISAVVDYHSEVIADSFGTRNLGSAECDFAKQSNILFCGIYDTRHVLSGNNKYMGRGLWIDVTEGNDLLIFVYRVRGNLASDDFAEQTVCIHEGISF
jgi:hypothetical protein